MTGGREYYTLEKNRSTTEKDIVVSPSRKKNRSPHHHPPSLYIGCRGPDVVFHVRASDSATGDILVVGIHSLDIYGHYHDADDERVSSPRCISSPFPFRRYFARPVAADCGRPTIVVPSGLPSDRSHLLRRPHTLLCVGGLWITRAITNTFARNWVISS